MMYFYYFVQNEESLDKLDSFTECNSKRIFIHFIVITNYCIIYRSDTQRRYNGKITLRHTFIIMTLNMIDQSLIHLFVPCLLMTSRTHLLPFNCACLFILLTLRYPLIPSKLYVSFNQIIVSILTGFL